MRKFSPPEDALLFVGTLFSQESVYRCAREELSVAFGKILFESEATPWAFSSCYDMELGTPIFRKFIFFDPLFDTAGIVDTKLTAVSLEKKMSVEGRRRINIDPGYLTLAKIVLTSTKNFSHRINLGRRVYGEITLLFRKDTFVGLPYTYRDYLHEFYIDVFMEAREMLKARLPGKAYSQISEEAEVNPFI